MLIRTPWVLGNRPLEIQPLVRLHAMQMLAHWSIRVLLNHEIQIPFFILIARRSVWPDDRLLHLRALVFGEQGRRDLQTGDGIFVWEGEAEFLGVVVDFLYGIQLEGDETLIAACERLRCWG